MIRAGQSRCRCRRPTASAKETGENIERILLGLATLVSFQSFLPISVINLAFLANYEDSTKGITNGFIL